VNPGERRISLGLKQALGDPWAEVARKIAPGSTAGLPGLVLPAGLSSSGLPVAVEFDAPAASDRDLLALGLSLERALGPIAPPKSNF